MTRTLVRQRGARALSGREMRVCVDAGTRWAWQLEPSLVAIYDVQIRAMYDQAAKLLARRARPLVAATPPAGWTIPDPDELGLSLREQMDDRHARRQAGDDASEAIRVEAVRRVTEAGLQAMGISLSTRNPLVEGVLRDQLGGKIVGIRETTRRDIMGKLEESWKAGDSIPRAARALRDSAPGIAASRSRTIARTEMLAAVNGGSHALAAISNAAGAQDGQPPLLKIWLTAEDERVRDSHVDAGDAYGAGSGIPIDEPFEVGDSRLQFPGDPDGSAGEVINCRCAISYEEPDDPAPADTSDEVADAIDSPGGGGDALSSLERPSTWGADVGQSADTYRAWDDARAAVRVAYSGGQGEATLDAARAIDTYSSEGYKKMNALLRGQDVGGANITRSVEEDVAGLSRAIETLGTPLPTDTQVFRGMTIREGADLAGTIVDDPAFLSTSLKASVAEEFATGKSAEGVERVILNLHAPAGTRVVPGEIKSEREYVFAAGSRYAIIDEAAPRTLGGGHVVRVFDAILLPPGAP